MRVICVLKGACVIARDDMLPDYSHAKGVKLIVISAIIT